MSFPTGIRLFAIVAALLFLCSPTHGQATDAMLSYRGFELGSHYDSLSIDQHKSLQKRGKFQKLIRFDVMAEHLHQDGIALRFVRLFYWHNHLHSIDVKSGNGQGNELREWIEKKFGEGIQEDAMGYKFLWEFPGYRVFLEQNLVTKDATITFLHDETHNSYYKFMYEKQYGTQNR